MKLYLLDWIFIIVKDEHTCDKKDPRIKNSVRLIHLCFKIWSILDGSI